MPYQGKWCQAPTKSSIKEVVFRGNQRGFKSNGTELDYTFVKNVIAGSTRDELHRMVKANYILRINGTEVFKID
jgi:hypothetical protein